MASNSHALIINGFPFVYLLLFLPYVESLNFSFPNFQNDLAFIDIMNSSYFNPTDGSIHLTNDLSRLSFENSVGRASYNKAMRLWDTTTKSLASFTTHFTFNISQPYGNQKGYYPGDGLAFFLAAPFNSSIAAPPGSAGGSLGLVCSPPCNMTHKDNAFVAVEFDTFSNSFDPISGPHVGIDVNSVNHSVAYNACNGIVNTPVPCEALITYESSSMNLSIFLTYYNHSPVFLSHVIDLRKYLPDTVRIGFSAATGLNFESHNILSWDFSSTLDDVEPVLSPPSKSSKSNELVRKNKNKNKVWLVGGVVPGVGILLVGLGLVGFMWWRRSSIAKNDDMDVILSLEFEGGDLPRRFTYNELSRATNNFARDKKLGEGGFGDVYLGSLIDPNKEIAVKKVSRRSRQGKKEYVSEVKIISRLRHKNLVQILGWCHERGDLLLVYEFMSNGSLDSYLYGAKKDPLPWTTRYKVTLDLASALVYLHEEWEQCVLHRDIKSSNVMLDSNFNAKLGDFGLARLVDHELGSQTTLLAGTLGYLDPECAITGKASKASDVYSFGVVALEIACGRRPIEPKEEPTKVNLIDWVWDLYGKGHLLEAADQSLEREFDVDQLKHLLIVGLWCCHPEYTLRPSISQVIKVLKFEATLPILPSTFPIFDHSLHSGRMEIFSMTSSEVRGSSLAVDSN